MHYALNSSLNFVILCVTWKLRSMPVWNKNQTVSLFNVKHATWKRAKKSAEKATTGKLAKVDHLCRLYPCVIGRSRVSDRSIRHTGCVWKLQQGLAAYSRRMLLVVSKDRWGNGEFKRFSGAHKARNLARIS